MKKKKLLLLASLSLAGLMALTSCDEKNNSLSGKFSEETIEYNTNLSQSALFNKTNQLITTTEPLLYGDVTEETPKAKVDALLEAGFTPESIGKIDGYKSTYKKVTVGQSVDDISAWGTDNSLIYPGSILRIQDPTSGNSAITSYGVKSGNIDISTSMYTSTGKSEGAVSNHVNEATLSNVRTAIGDLVDKNLVDGSVHACQISSSVQEVKNEIELSVVLGSSTSNVSNSQISAMVSQSGQLFGAREAIGADGSYLSAGNTKVVKNSNKSSGDSHYYACIQLTQVYYSMDIDLVYDANDIITENLSEDRISYLKSLGGIPGVVSSVKYGRKAVCVLELDCSYSDYIKEVNEKSTTYDNAELSAVAEAGFRNNFNAEAGASGSTDKQDSNNSNSTTQNSAADHVLNSKCFIYGGDNESSLKAVESTTASEIVKAFTSSVDPKKMVGCPISYTVRSIDGQNSLIKIGSSDTYYERELTPIIPNGDITLSKEDAREIDEICLGSSIEIAANREPIDSTLFPFVYSLNFDNPDIIKEKITDGYNYKYGDKIIASVTQKYDKFIIELEDDNYLAGQKASLVVEYEDDKYSGYTLTKKFTIKPYTLTIKDSNKEVVSTVFSTKNNGKYVVDLENLVISGKKYNRFFDENNNLISDKVIELSSNSTIVLPKDVKVTLSNKDNLTNETVIKLQDGDTISYSQLLNYINFDETKYELSRIVINGKALDENDQITVNEDIDVNILLNSIESYTLTIKDAKGNVVDSYKTININGVCYVDLPNLTYNNIEYNRIFDENHNVVANDRIVLTSDVVYKLPKILTCTLKGTGLKNEKTFEFQEEDSNLSIFTKLKDILDYDSSLYEFKYFYDVHENKIDNNYNFITTENFTVYAKFEDISQGSITFNYNYFKNMSVSFDISYFVEYFPEIGNTLEVSDFLKDLKITVDYDTKTVTVDSIVAKEYYDSFREYGTDYSYDLTPLSIVRNEDLSSSGDTTAYTDYTGYGVGWKYILFENENNKSLDGSLTVNDLSNVKLIISVCRHYGASDAYSNDWYDYYPLIISLDLSK